MFIPSGEIIHESLATSYVLVDALVADLCEGGFSGVVEVVLRETDSFIVIASGDIAAVCDKRGDGAISDANITYTRTTVDELAERSRLERGRVSIYAYEASTAGAVAGCINAKTLYVGLSTEFTDLEKMISKLVREHDREWFIVINAENGPGALIHMRGSECRIISATGQVDSGALNLPNNPVLGRLIYECNRSGGTFDVYFTPATTELLDEPEPATPQPIFVAFPVEDATMQEGPVESPRLQYAEPSSFAMSELYVDSGLEPETPVVSDLDEENFDEVTVDQLEVSSEPVAAAVAGQPSFAASLESAPLPLTEDVIEPVAGNLPLVWDELPTVSADAEAMAEVKRLMGEIARAIEEAAQAVGRSDSFSMALRAGQLKIADRFSFLDPFAGEFEYLAGEIVFVGHAPAEEFVAGLTEALKLAIESVSRSTSYADRFRSYVAEDLRKLLARERAAFDAYGLDQVIEQLLTDDRWRTADR